MWRCDVLEDFLVILPEKKGRGDDEECTGGRVRERSVWVCVVLWFCFSIFCFLRGSEEMGINKSFGLWFPARTTLAKVMKFLSLLFYLWLVILRKCPLLKLYTSPSQTDCSSPHIVARRGSHRTCYQGLTTITAVTATLGSVSKVW